jgi:hypothetical protein
MARWGVDLHRSVEDPTLRGIVMRRGDAFSDFAAIVIDTAIEPPRNFGLVIFNAPSADNEDWEPHWVLKEQDLSRTEIEYTSFDLYVTDYTEEGTAQVCVVSWKPRSHTYVCGRRTSTRYLP